MKFVCIFGKKPSPEQYILSRWAESLAHKGHEVELLLPLGGQCPDMQFGNSTLRWWKEGQRLSPAGDACIAVHYGLLDTLGDWIGSRFILWNQTGYPPERKGVHLLACSRFLEEYIPNYIPPLLDRRIFENVPLQEEEREQHILFLGGEESYALEKTLQALDLIRHSLPGLELYLVGGEGPVPHAVTPVRLVPYPQTILERIRLFWGARLAIWAGGECGKAFNPQPLEIMACGVPLLTFTMEGMMDYARPKENCMFLARDSVKELAVQYLTMYREGPRRQEITEKAHALARRYINVPVETYLETLTLCTLGLDDKEGVSEEMGSWVDVIVISYNNLELLKACLESISRYTFHPHSIIVVDNGSTDGSQEYLQGRDDLLCLYNEENAGYARACNQGILAGSGQYIVLMNCDVEVMEGWLEPLLQRAESNEELAVIGPKLLNEEGLIMGAGVVEMDDICSPRGWKVPDGPGVYEETEEVINVSGACYLIKRDLLTSLGLFDEGYFFYFEETDYSLRAREKGYKVLYCPESKVIHHHEGGKSGEDRTFRNTCFLQSQKRFRGKWQDLLEGKEKRGLEKTILALGIIPWEMRYQRPQQLLTRFARNGYRVLYINPYAANSSVQKVEDNLYTSTPSGFGTALLHLQYKERREDMSSSIKKDMAALQMFRPVLWVDVPYWEPLIKHFEHSLLLYNCMDDYGEFPDLARHGPLAEQERKLIQASDLILTPSQKLYEEKGEHSQSVFRVPNGVDWRFFSRVLEEELPCPGEMKGLEHPIVLYYGAIGYWFDVELVKHFAGRMERGSIVLLGGVSCDVEALQDVERVHLFGEIDYQRLPSFLQQAHLCFIPFKDNALTQATNPVKVYEYMAAGRNVLSVPLPELQDFSHLLTLAWGEEFVEKGLSLLQSYPRGLPEEEAKRLSQSMKSEDWHCRRKHIEQCIYESYGEEGGREIEEDLEAHQQHVLGDEDLSQEGGASLWSRVKQWFSGAFL